MRKIIVLICLLLALKLVGREREQAIGLAAGYISGTGFAYREMSNDSGFQIGAGHVSTHQVGKRQFTASNLAYSYYHNFANTDKIKFYFLLGANYFHRYSDNDSEPSNYINLGAGIGAELAITQHMKMAIEWPWYYEGRSNFIKFIPQTGIYYYW